MAGVAEGVGTSVATGGVASGWPSSGGPALDSGVVCIVTAVVSGVAPRGGACVIAGRNVSDGPSGGSGVDTGVPLSVASGTSLSVGIGVSTSGPVAAGVASTGGPSVGSVVTDSHGCVASGDSHGCVASGVTSG